jgi:hypothetical protein
MSMTRIEDTSAEKLGPDASVVCVVAGSLSLRFQMITPTVCPTIPWMTRSASLPPTHPP